MDQAHVRAMQVATETPGDYGSAYSGTPMAFEVVSSEETEDHYAIELSLRPQGDFSGRLGREQFFIEKEGSVVHRQVLSLPSSARWWRSSVTLVVVGLVVVGAAAVSGVFAATGGGEFDDAAPLAAALAAATPELPALTPSPASTTAPAVVPPVVPNATLTSASFPTATVQVPTPTPLPVVATPTQTPNGLGDAEPPPGSVTFRNHYYLTVPQRMTWAEAAAYSRSLGGHLVTISDEEENRFVSDLGQTMYDGWVSHNSFWIGLTDEEQEGRFLWVTGESNSYTNWSGSEPNNSGNEDYVTIGQNSRDSWNDHPSKDKRPFVVEFESRLAAGGIPIPTFMPTPTPLPAATSTPQPTPVATTTPEILQNLLSEPWLRGSDTEDRTFSVPVLRVVLNSDATKMYAFAGDRLYKSSDAGRTWKQNASPSPISNDSRDNLIVGPSPDILFTHSNYGFQQTTDGGHTWNQISMPEACCLAVAAVDGFLLGAQESEDRSIFRSSDQGQTWREVSRMRSAGFVSEFLPVPGQPSTLYSWNTRNPKGAGGGIGLFFSEDGGFSWTPVPPPSDLSWSAGSQDGFAFDSADPPNIYRAIEGKFFKTNALEPGLWVVAPWAERVQGYLVTFHPTDPNVFAVLTRGNPLFATLDGGQTFIPLHEAGYQIGNTIYAGLPQGSHPLVIVPDFPPTICIGSASGVWCYKLGE